jgi:Ca2+-binding RTX toxin-like protein
VYVCGDDTLFGGTGIDGLQGDAGNDNFVFNPGTAAGDVIRV